ncbi:VWFA domain-containing protein [Entamoeba marina]
MSELDLVFICDSTGSMGSYLAAAQNSIKKVVSDVTQSEKCDVRFALVEYKDHPPQGNTFATRVTDFTSSMKEIQGAVDQMQATGGGDGPESVACAFQNCANLSYREKSSKVAVWIADAPPHGFCPNSGDGFPDGCPCGYDFIEMVHECMNKGIVFYAIGAEPLSFSYLRTLMRTVAEMTGGQYAALASADVLGDLITASSIEEIQTTRILSSINDELEKDANYKAMNPTQKKLHVQKRLREEANKTQIKSLVLDSIFEGDLPAIPEIFEKAENLKQLKAGLSNQPDIQVTFKNSFNSSSPGTFSFAPSMPTAMPHPMAARPMTSSAIKPSPAGSSAFGSFNPMQSSRMGSNPTVPSQNATSSYQPISQQQQMRMQKKFFNSPAQRFDYA